MPQTHPHERASGRLVPSTVTEPLRREGRIQWITTTVDAFVPNPVPPPLDARDVHYELYQPNINAERAISQLEGSAGNLPNPHILIGPFVQREAILSSKIENTVATPEQIALFEANVAPRQDDSDAAEVYNYIRSLEFGLKSELPLSPRLLRLMHRELLSGVRGDEANPGEFRRTQNYIGPRNRGAEHARYVPPPPQHLQDLLNNFERFLHAPCNLPRLVRIAIAHYQFEAIHPFNDGNGRVGRLLIVLQLCGEGQLSQPLLYPSGYFEKHRGEYSDLLLAVSQEGKWHEWFQFFLEALRVQAMDALKRAAELRSLQSEYYRRVRIPRASSRLPVLIDEVFSRPFMTAKRVRQITGASAANAIALCEKLAQFRILREVASGSRQRFWIADDIIDIISKEYDLDTLRVC